jgi:hypothetical protein
VPSISLIRSCCAAVRIDRKLSCLSLDYPDLNSIQSLRLQSMATPRLVQWPGGSLDGMRTVIRKLVEWPVVARTPLLSAVR